MFVMNRQKFVIIQLLFVVMRGMFLFKEFARIAGVSRAGAVGVGNRHERQKIISPDEN
jgi:hypothetical protein